MGNIFRSMKKEEISNLKVQIVAEATLPILRILDKDDLDILIEELEEHYECKFHEIPQEDVFNAIRELILDDSFTDLPDILQHDGDLEVNIWKNE